MSKDLHLWRLTRHLTNFIAFQKNIELKTSARVGLLFLQETEMLLTQFKIQSNTAQILFNEFIPNTLKVIYFYDNIKKLPRSWYSECSDVVTSRALHKENKRYAS